MRGDVCVCVIVFLLKTRGEKKIFFFFPSPFMISYPPPPSPVHPIFYGRLMPTLLKKRKSINHFDSTLNGLPGKIDH
jgi:hypothetical protein